MKKVCVLISAALVCLVAGASVAAVVVSPDNMNGWTTAVNAGGTCSFLSSGPVLSERSDGFRSGNGALFVKCDYNGQSTNDPTPSTVWIGTDTNNGQSLAGITIDRIKTLKYTAYVSDFPPQHKHDISPDLETWMYPAEPIALQLVVEDPQIPGKRRNLWFRAWGATPLGYTLYGDLANLVGQWITYDCINCTYDRGIIPGSTARWVQPLNLLQPDGITYLCEEFANWEEVKAKYGTWKLVSTAPVGDGYRSAGWNPGTTPPGNLTSTATGTCLNFEVGARNVTCKDIFNQTAATAWYKEALGSKGYLDNFTLGIDYDGTEVVTTYDFEAAAADVAPRIVATNIRSMCESAATPAGVPYSAHYGYSKIWNDNGTSTIDTLFRSRICGKVSNYSEVKYYRVTDLWIKTFDLKDGSPLIPSNVKTRVVVRDKGNVLDIRNDDWVAVTGYIKKMPWAWNHELAPPANSQPWYVWADAGNVNSLSYP